MSTNEMSSSVMKRQRTELTQQALLHPQITTTTTSDDQTDEQWLKETNADRKSKND